jgi:hypothetical protein
VFALEFAQAGPTYAASYVIDGLTLGQSVRNQPSFRRYRCEAEIFPGITECTRGQAGTPSGGTHSGKVMRTEDGTAVYLMATVSPATLNDDAVRTEIEKLSSEFKEKPRRIERLSERSGVPNSVIAVWGNVELRLLRPEDFREGEFDPNWPGIFLDPLGDMERSVKAGLPIYRVAGGPGYVYSASFDSTGHGHRRTEAVDIARPLARKFELELRDILRKDRSSVGSDYGLWPEVARLTRISCSQYLCNDRERGIGSRPRR